MASDQSPEFSGWLLFLAELAINFKHCNSARYNNNLQDLLRSLESCSLMLMGYYKTKEQEQQIHITIIKLKRELNEVIKIYSQTEKLEISEQLWIDFYNFESELWHIWKESGLQMALRNKDELEDF